MDSESQPLLADVEDNHTPMVPSMSDAAHSEPQHICARCASELGLRREEPGVHVYLRIVLILAAIILCIAIFIFAVLTLVSARRSHASQIMAAIWADVTIAVLAILVYVGRHRKSHGGHKLGRTTTQIYVLCGLAVSWILLTVGLIIQNSRACTRDHLGCGFFTTAHVLAWFLIITLFWAAYTTYQRAVNIHGSALVPNPAMISAWRLSDIANDGATGAIKI